MPSALPIDAVLPEIVDAMRTARRLVLSAPPGAGKTTRVPPALLDSGVAGDKSILVLEPRRIAARLAARRVAVERNGRLGDEVGYRVRFEHAASAATRILFMTEGVLLRRLLDDPLLEGVGCVVLDEFHERHLDADLALALLWRLRQQRPELGLLVMSATLEHAAIAHFLDDAPVVQAAGRVYPVTVQHAAREDTRPLQAQVAARVRTVLVQEDSGDVLVFLPGAAEIRRAREALALLATERELDLLPLYGDLPVDAQDRAVRPGSRRKVVLATNIAESSVTIDGVVAVVDSGLARVPVHQHWSGLPALEVHKISRASCEQRAGRAGRTRPGRCERLFTAADYHARTEQTRPEIQRLDLCQLRLLLARRNVLKIEQLQWLEAPPAAAWSAAGELLSWLGAIAAQGQLTAQGEAMLRFPLHPRLGRLLLAGADAGVFGAACTIAALLSERDVLDRRGVLDGGGGAGMSTDLLQRLALIEQQKSVGKTRGRPRAAGLNLVAVERVQRVAEQLRRRGGGGPGNPSTASDYALAQCVLQAFPDRVARRRQDSGELVLANGGSAVLVDDSDVAPGALVVAVSATERRQGTHARTLVYLTCDIEAEWLLELLPERVSEENACHFNESRGVVERSSRLQYGQLVLAESQLEVRGDPQAAQLLAEAVRRAGLHAICDFERLESLRGRLQLAHTLEPDAGCVPIDDAALLRTLEELCLQCQSLDELRHADLHATLQHKLTRAAQQRLAQLCPEHISLPGRRRTPVQYPAEGTACISSYIQDFFGLSETPSIGAGRQPLQLHLLAPNRRAVQVTQDLPSFWREHYARVRKGLRRRYPRHRWPEDPLRPDKG